MTTTSQATSAAIRLARHAARTGAGVLDCPYPPESTGVASAARRVWLAEFQRLKPGTPVDFGDRVLAIAHGPDTGDDGTMPGGPGPDLFAEVPR